ncbi:patatin-like phospholipase family protein [Methyloversatilis sp.]|uniref:patatin-like phospholipase family protein n=1 Tax=Methyloversatilis sp. TaxID=2569862 RepID=UPI0035B3BF3D
MPNVFTQDPEVVKAVKRIADRTRGREYSDLIDDEGHQYIDFVMEGGGVLGISLLGYAYALEQAGIRMLGLGGTSAGSIVALILASLGPAHEPKAERAVDILARMPMGSFMDGDSDARDFTDSMLEKAGMFKLLFKALQCVDNLKDDLGLHPGDAFEKWLTGELANCGVRTLADLDARLVAKPPGLRHRLNNEGFDAARACGKLVVIAADVSTETKVDLPRMAPMYWKNPAEVNPARFARASMSIPLFFHPFSVAVPQDAATKEHWRTLGRFDHELPKKAVFMDGGIMSNFPINTFHVSTRAPFSPTFGAKIGFDRNVRNVSTPARLLGAIFDSARHTLDFDFINSNPDYKRLVAHIDVEDKHNWLNFNMKPAEQKQLFLAGVLEAETFLCGNDTRPGFDWADYKKLRAALLAAR